MGGSAPAATLLYPGRMADTSTYDRILRLRAIRSYRPEPLSEEDLTRILESARWTGSSKNRQAWSFVVVRDPEQRARLAECGDFTDPVRAAPVTLAIVEEPGGNHFDTGRVAQNVMLAADALGVASCPVTLHRSADAARVLELPDGRTVRWAVTLGYPAPEAAPARFGGRKPLERLVHWDRYGSV